MALGLTGALAQSPDSPLAFSFQLVTTFDYPGTGNQTRPQKINDLGDIGGLFVNPSAESFGFMRLNNGSFSHPISDPNATTNFTEGRGINNSRVICGDYLDSAGAFEGFFLSGRTFTNYDPDPTFTIVLGINNAGDFCGSSIPTATGVQSAFTNIGGVKTDFSVTNSTATLAYQLNATNTSCGYYIDATDGLTHGYYRDPNGTIHAPIDPVGSTGTILFGNNDRNLIVGRYSDSAGATHAIVFLPPNRFLVYDFPGATFTSFNGINRANTITGRYTDPSTAIDHGIIVQLVRSGAGGVTLPLAPPSAPAQQAAPQQGVPVAPAY